jgi:hypothetical protein
MNYKITTDNLEWYGLQDGDILTLQDHGIGEVDYWLSNGSLDNTFYNLDKIAYQHPTWVMEIKNYFSLEEMFSFGIFVNRHIKTLDKTQNWIQNYFERWLNNKE